MKHIKILNTALLFSVSLILSVYSSNALSQSDAIRDSGNVAGNEITQVDKNYASVVVYRDAGSQTKGVKPITVYVNEHVAGVLLPNSYMSVPTCVGNVDLGFAATNNRAKLRIQPPISVGESKATYIKLAEASNAQFLVQGVDAVVAENELKNIAKISQVINRYVPDCTVKKTALRQISLGTDALFAFNSAEISPAGFAQLDSFIADLNGQKNRISGLNIVGHTDFLGDERYNQELSLARAKSVAEYFKGHGLNLPMNIEGRGEAEPVSDGCKRLTKERNSMIACLQRDRRVVIGVMGK